MDNEQAEAVARLIAEKAIITARWTPGPWVLDEAGIWSVTAAEIVAQTCVPDDYIHLPDDEIPSDVRALLYANARLIAAAPTMADYIGRRAACGDTEAGEIMETVRGNS